MTPRERPRRVRLLLSAAVGLWIVACVCLLVEAYRSAGTATRETVAARRALSGSGLDNETVTRHLDVARQAFDRAHRWSTVPVLVPVRALPVVGRQLRSFSALASAAARAVSIGTTTAEGIETALEEPPSTPAARLDVLRTMAGLAARADAALGRVPLARESGLLPILDRHWAELDGDVRSARDRFHAGAAVLTTVASALAGPQRYLLLAANNAEMRAGSGMFLGIGSLSTADGNLELGAMHAAGDMTLPGAGVEVGGDLAARWGWLEPGREWRNLGTTPRFDATAPVAAQMWERLTGEPVDGVLVVDVELVRAVLESTGPVLIGDETVSADGVTSYLLHDQYRGLNVEDPQTARREQLGHLVQAAFGAIERGDFSAEVLGRQILAVTEGRHVLVWSRRADDQRTWSVAGVSGELSPTSLAANVVNRGGNKLDPFVEIHAALDVRPGDVTEASVRVTVHNGVPPGESSYIAGPHPDADAHEGDYLGIVAVNLPGGATDVNVEGAPALLSAGPDGPTFVVAVPLLLPRGQDASVGIRFRLPASIRSMTVVPSARLPPIRWEVAGREWLDDRSRLVRW